MDRVWVVYQEVIGYEDCPECGYEMKFGETEFIFSYSSLILAEAKVQLMKNAGAKRAYIQSVPFFQPE